MKNQGNASLLVWSLEAWALGWDLLCFYYFTSAFLKFRTHNWMSAACSCCSTSNWRFTETLGDYLAKRNIMGICKSKTKLLESWIGKELLLASITEFLSFLFCFFGCAIDDVDTRAITRRLREDGSLIGVLSTEESKSDQQLLEMARSWDIVGRFLVL